MKSLKSQQIKINRNRSSKDASYDKKNSRKKVARKKENMHIARAVYNEQAHNWASSQRKTLSPLSAALTLRISKLSFSFEKEMSMPFCEGLLPLSYTPCPKELLRFRACLGCWEHSSQSFWPPSVHQRSAKRERMDDF